MTSYPGTGRKSALLGRVRTCQGACLVNSPTLAVHGQSASPHPVPALALGWSVHQPGEVCRLRPPAPVLRGGLQDHRASHLRGARRKAHITGRRHAPCSYIMNPKTYPRHPPPVGEVLPVLSPPPAQGCARHSGAPTAPHMSSSGLSHGCPVEEWWTKCMALILL